MLHSMPLNALSVHPASRKWHSYIAYSESEDRYLAIYMNSNCDDIWTPPITLRPLYHPPQCPVIAGSAAAACGAAGSGAITSEPATSEGCARVGCTSGAGA